MTDPAPGRLSYAEALAELNSIIGELDVGLVDVDALTARFQRAIDIVEDLDGRIRRARAKVDELTPRLDAILTAGAEPVEAPDAPAGPEERGTLL